MPVNTSYTGELHACPHLLHGRATRLSTPPTRESYTPIHISQHGRATCLSTPPTRESYTPVHTSYTGELHACCLSCHRRPDARVGHHQPASRHTTLACWCRRRHWWRRWHSATQRWHLSHSSQKRNSILKALATDTAHILYVGKKEDCCDVEVYKKLFL